MLGGLGVFASSVLLATMVRLDEPPDAARIATVAAIASLSALEIVAGVMILRLSNRWRTIGVVLAAAGVALALANLLAGAPPIGSLLSLAANLFIVVTLVRLRHAFAR